MILSTSLLEISYEQHVSGYRLTQYNSGVSKALVGSEIWDLFIENQEK